MRTRGNLGSSSPGGKGGSPNTGGGGFGMAIFGLIFRSWRYTAGGILRTRSGRNVASSLREFTVE